MKKKFNILGAEYTIEVLTVEQDSYLANCEGYTDKSSHRIVVRAKDDKNELDNFEWYQKKVMRHEIIHAFFNESGLSECFEHKQWGHEETTVDWFAIQSPKIFKVFEEVGCL